MALTILKLDPAPIDAAHIAADERITLSMIARNTRLERWSVEDNGRNHKYRCYELSALVSLVYNYKP